ncbi:MAG: transposase [Pseudomonadota bacterium]
MAIVADKAYGGNPIRQAIADEGSVAVIPSKSDDCIPVPHDPNIYAKRNELERFFCKMKDMRRLTTRYAKLKRNFQSMPHIFAVRCWLNWVQTLEAGAIALA